MAAGRRPHYREDGADRRKIRQRAHHPFRDAPAVPRAKLSHFQAVVQCTGDESVKTLMALLLLASLPVAMAQSRPIPVIFDTDIGDDIDDALALALALQ